MAAILGCPSSYSVELYWTPRDADPPGMWLRTTLTGVRRIQWGRTLDGTSTARVEIDGKQLTGDCGRILSQVDAWRHEIRIKRDDDPVWEGPVTRDLQDTNVRQPFILDAADVSVWFSRNQSVSFPDTTGDVSGIADDVLQIAFGDNQQSPWPGDNQQILPYLVTIPTGKTVRYRRLFDELGDGLLISQITDLVDLGLDWTVVGRSIYLTTRDTTASVPVARLDQTHFTGSAEVEQDGMDIVTTVAVKTDNTWQPGNRSTRGPYGRHVQILTLDEFSLTNINREVHEIMSGRTVPVLVVSTPAGSLRDTVPWPLARMIPGRRVDLAATIGATRTIEQPRVLADLDVDWVPGGIETVKVALIPAGDPDDAEEGL